ncbi:MAG: hypothetical protein ACE5IY_09720 [bacterium]
MKRLSSLRYTIFSIFVIPMLLACAGSEKTPVGAEYPALSLGLGAPEIPPPAFAGHPGPRLHGVRMLTDVLDLSAEQQEQVKAIIEQNRPEFGHRRRGRMDADSFAGLKAKRQEMREKVYKEVLAILTPEQRTRAEAMKAQLDRGEVPQEFVDKHIEHLTEKLDLTAEQQEQIRALQTAQKLLDLHNSTDSARERRAKHRDIMQNAHDQMLNILTPEQQEIFQEMISEHQQKMKERFQAHAHDRIQRRLAHLTDQLDLDAGQQAQLEEILTQFTPPIGEGPVARSPGHNRDEMRQQRHAQRKEIEEKIKSILTPEQLQKYEEMKAGRQRH